MPKRSWEPHITQPWGRPAMRHPDDSSMGHSLVVGNCLPLSAKRYAAADSLWPRNWPQINQKKGNYPLATANDVLADSTLS